MSPVTVDTVCRDLREFLTQQVLGGAVLDDETPLADAGVDSFALVEAVLFIERQHGVVVPLERLTREHTRSVGTLGRCVAGIAAESR